MSKKKVSILMLSICSLVVLLVALGLAGESSVAKAGVPDTPESREIQNTMHHAYKLMGLAAQTFDVSEFATVFVDTPHYELSDRQREAVTQVMGAKAAEAENVGYLTAMRAYYMSWGNGATALESTMNKANAESRQVTATEMQEIVKANGGRVPALARQETNETELKFESIEIKGNEALVQYDDGAALQEATLIKIDGHWYISSIRPIWVHF